MLRAIVDRSLIFGVALLLSFQLHEKEVKKIYVTVKGNDSNDGSVGRPLASLEAAKQAVRALKRSGFASSIEVIVRGGIYYLPETLEFTTEDSGTKSAPIIWKAAEGEKVILSGGKRIKGAWQKKNDGIWFIDIPEAKGWKRDALHAEVYAKKPEFPLNFRQLFVNEKRAIRARYPNANLENPFLYSVANTNGKVQIPEGMIKKSWG
ncbi:MAG: hypothetical protein RLZZ42_69, partial [Bacteroidota bacterium]